MGRNTPPGGQDCSEERCRQRVLHNLVQKAKAMAGSSSPLTTPLENTMKINRLSGVS